MQGAACTFVIPYFVTEFDDIYHYLWWIFAVFPYLETLKDLIRSTAKYIRCLEYMEMNPTTTIVASQYGGWYGTPVFMKCTCDTLTMEETLVVEDMVASQWVVVP